MKNQETEFGGLVWEEVPSVRPFVWFLLVVLAMTISVLTTTPQEDSSDKPAPNHVGSPP